MKTRNSPSRHNVRDYSKRNDTHVPSYMRGSGSRVAPYTGDYKPLKEPPKDEHKRELKKPGDIISYMDNDKRVNGIVKGVRQEYYLVERDGKIWKVDRRSIFTRVGGALKETAFKVAGSISAKLERRAEEREHWRRVREEMKREEKMKLERAKMRAKHNKEMVKIRKEIREGPLWQRTAKAVGAQASKQILGKGRRPKRRK